MEFDWPGCHYRQCPFVLEGLKVQTATWWLPSHLKHLTLLLQSETKQPCFKHLKHRFSFFNIFFLTSGLVIISHDFFVDKSCITVVCFHHVDFFSNVCLKFSQDLSFLKRLLLKPGPGPQKTWTLKKPDPVKAGPWKTWKTARCRKMIRFSKGCSTKAWILLVFWVWSEIPQN